MRSHCGYRGWVLPTLSGMGMGGGPFRVCGQLGLEEESFVRRGKDGGVGHDTPTFLHNVRKNDWTDWVSHAVHLPGGRIDKWFSALSFWKYQLLWNLVEWRIRLFSVVHTLLSVRKAGEHVKWRNGFFIMTALVQIARHFASHHDSLSRSYRSERHHTHNR